MQKISYEVNGEWIDHSHKPEYELQKNRVLIALPAEKINLLLDFINLLSPPLYVLYVLHTSRGEAEIGRYQSPELEKQEVFELMNEYSAFFAADSRFDLWFYSPSEKSTVVWDRHNLVYIYGPLIEVEEIILKNGFARGHPKINFDHIHHYRQEFDAASKRLLDRYRWVYSPLKPSDTQGV